MNGCLNVNLHHCERRRSNPDFTMMPLDCRAASRLAMTEIHIGAPISFFDRSIQTEILVHLHHSDCHPGESRDPVLKLVPSPVFWIPSQEPGMITWVMSVTPKGHWTHTPATGCQPRSGRVSGPLRRCESINPHARRLDRQSLKIWPTTASIGSTNN